MIGKRRYASAWGPSKKEAEQKAAYQALRELNAIDPAEEYEPETETG
jgi:dsRNA-specific ribonuclease